MFAMPGLVREPFRGRKSLGLGIGLESGKKKGGVCGVLVMGLLVCEQEIKDGQIETKGGTQGCRENGRKKERITVRNKSEVCHPEVWLPSGSVVRIRGKWDNSPGDSKLLLLSPWNHAPTEWHHLRSTGPLLTGTVSLSHPWPFCLLHPHHVYLVSKNIYISNT